MSDITSNNAQAEPVPSLYVPRDIKPSRRPRRTRDAVRGIKSASEWDYSGYVPVAEGERLDARFKNSIRKPPRKGKGVIGPARGIRHSNLEPGQSVFDLDKPRFDLNRFKTGQRLDYIDHRIDDAGDAILTQQIQPLNTSTGAAVPAVCEGARCGDYAKSTAKNGSTSHECLSRKARIPINLVAATVAHDVPVIDVNIGGLFVGAIMKDRFFRPKKITHYDGSVSIQHVILVRHNGRDLKHIDREWFGDDYPWRWDQAASCYLDVRIDGKATNGFDLTWPQAAGRIADEAVDCLTTRPDLKHDGRKCPLIFYDTPVLGFALLWLMAGLDAPLSDFWLFVAEPPNTKKESHRYIPANIYWIRTKEGPKVAHLVTLNGLIGDGILARFYRECFRQVAKAIRGKGWRPAVPTARDKVIADHWRLCESRVRKSKVPKPERADCIQACMKRLCTVYDDWNPELGSFGTFVEQPIEWEIQDYLKRLRKQIPVQRSINPNDPADKSADDDDDDDNAPKQERPDMSINTLEKQTTASKRRLVAERLDCLDLGEQRVIEGILGLNGYRHPVEEKKELAAELGMSVRHMARIEKAAIEKLQRAVL